MNIHTFDKCINISTYARSCMYMHMFTYGEPIGLTMITHTPIIPTSDSDWWLDEPTCLVIMLPWQSHIRIPWKAKKHFFCFDQLGSHLWLYGQPQTEKSEQTNIVVYRNLANWHRSPANRAGDRIYESTYHLETYLPFPLRPIRLSEPHGDKCISPSIPTICCLVAPRTRQVRERWVPARPRHGTIAIVVNESYKPRELYSPIAINNNHSVDY